MSPCIADEQRRIAFHHATDLRRAFVNVGHVVAPQFDWVVGELDLLARELGLEDVQQRVHMIQICGATEQGRNYLENVRLALRAMPPFLPRWTHVPDTYDDLYQRALADIDQPDFLVYWPVVTTWGRKPS